MTKDRKPGPVEKTETGFRIRGRMCPPESKPIRSKPIEFVRFEGEFWYDWKWMEETINQGQKTYIRAIKFEDGSIFDFISGWRDS